MKTCSCGYEAGDYDVVCSKCGASLEAQGKFFDPIPKKLPWSRTESESDGPVNPRSEVSADAKYVAGRIVTHMWILGFILPVVFGLLYEAIR